jgi:penicillin amidase
MRRPAPRVLCLGLALLALTTAHVRGAPAPRTAEIVRDRFGVPHVYVDGRGDDALLTATYALGYAQAEDRLFQMDVFRRAARGRLTELPATGAAFLAMDIEARRDGSTPEELEREVGLLHVRDRRVLTAFSAGVNRRIAEVTADPTQLPFEYLGRPPEPWRESDTLAIGELQFGRFGTGGGNELANARLLLELRARFPEHEARGIFDDLLPIDDPSSPVTIAPDERRFEDRDHVVRFAPAQMAVLDRLGAALVGAAAALGAERAAHLALARRLAIPPVGGPASNAIVVAGRHTASGHPILLGGPQTGLNIPSFFWEGGIHGGGRDIHGVGVPGTPGVTIGRNAALAFTITSAIDDDTDVYAELLDPADPGRYLHRGQSLAFERRVETFVVAGAPSVTREFLRTVHGPVIFVDQAAGLAFSRRRALDGLVRRAGSRVLKLALTDTLDDFLQLAREVDAGFNFHVADTRGNIAYVHAGRRPRRPEGTDPRLPLLGTGEHEWEGVWRHRPEVTNPASGTIVNWNNKPAAGWPVGDQRDQWGPLHRVQGLTDGLAAALASGQPLTPQGVSDVMRHAAESDIFAARLVPFLADAVAALPPAAADRARLVQASDLVETWVDAGAPLVAVGATLPHPGATIYRAFRTEAQRRIFGDELGTANREMFYPLLNEFNQEDDHGAFDTPDALFHRALVGAAAALPLSRDYFRNVATGDAPGRDGALVAALRSALAALAARFGSNDMAGWLEPALRESYMNLGAVNLFFGETIAARQNRGSFNLLAELDGPTGGRIIVPPGESGAIPAGALGPEPPHLRDQLPLYEAFAYRQIPRTRADIEAPTVTTTLDVPGGF